MTYKTGLMQDKVPARYYGQLAAVLQSNGINPVSVFRAAELSETQLADPEGYISIAELERLVAAISAHDGGNEITLQAGRTIRLRNHSVVGFAVASSPNTDYALRLVMRFFRLIFPAFRMRYRRGQDSAEISYQPAMHMSHACLAFHIELIAAATHSAIEELSQRTLPEYELALSISPPAHLALYRRYMPQARIQFAALPSPGIRFHLPAHVVTGQPSMANRESLELAEQRCRLMVEQIVDARNIGEWTRMMLRESSDGLPTIEELAATMNITPRTLHRYLKREGFVYRSLCVEERERRARELLSGTTLSVTRIAQELGYNDASNFTRAFRKATGLSPSEYRDQAGL